MQLIKELSEELDRLKNPDYRKLQKVWAGEKQLKHLKRMLSKINLKKEETVDDFCRVLSDCAPLKSKISMLADVLYDNLE